MNKPKKKNTTNKSINASVEEYVNVNKSLQLNALSDLQIKQHNKKQPLIKESPKLDKINFFPTAFFEHNKTVNEMSYTSQWSTPIFAV